MLILTEKQRDTFLKIVLNASNAVLGGLVLSSVVSQHFRVGTFLLGLMLYGSLIVAAMLLSH